MRVLFSRGRLPDVPPARRGPGTGQGSSGPRLGAGAAGSRGHSLPPTDSLSFHAFPRALDVTPPARSGPYQDLPLAAPTSAMPFAGPGTLGQRAAGLLALSHRVLEKRQVQSHLASRRDLGAINSHAGSGLNRGPQAGGGSSRTRAQGSACSRFCRSWGSWLRPASGGRGSSSCPCSCAHGDTPI